jgi:WD40 repeat protein/energy-coupling factor transporter ATP-binding protein EcfA2
MSQEQDRNNAKGQPPNQQQSLGDVQVQGDDNILNVIQAEMVTLTQNKIIQISVNEVKTRLFLDTSPYKGLRSFEPADRDQFFGRDQFLAGLVNELEQTNLVLLLGASGSGKSSVVRAGLVPWLTQKWETQFVNLTFTPDQDPFESLYGSLLQHFKQSEVQLARAGDVDTLSRLVKTLKPPEAFWFVFIDQFEELFTTSSPDKRDRFITSLAQLCKEKSGDRTLKVVATMRADFLDRLDTAPANRLARATEKHRPLITQMHPDELRLAIEQPAAHHGVVFETGLVETIITDVQGQAGYLPLLQYTLNRLWQTERETSNLQQERMLHTRTYMQLGGVRGTLQKHVDDIYGQLKKEEKHLSAQRIFLKLVEIGGDVASGTEWRPVRRRASRAEFEDDQEKAVLAELIDEKLLVSDRSPASKESTVEIAHEILLTSWDTLKTWIEENREAIALRNRLNDDVAIWHTQKSDEELWTGSRLEQVLELSKEPNFNQVLGGFSPLAVEFIKVSESKRDHQRRRTIVGLAGFSGVALLLAAFAGLQWRQAEVGQVQAVAQSSRAEFTVNSDSLEPLLSALRAGGKFQRLPFKGRETQLYDEVMETLTQAVFWAREMDRLEGHTNIVSGVSFSPDDQTIATASFDGTAKIWEATGQEVTTLEGHTDGVTSVSLSSQGDLLVTTSFDGTARLWTPSGKEIAVLEGHTNTVWSASFSPDGQTLATASDDGTVRFWGRDGKAQPLVLQGGGGGISSVSFSPDGQTIATGNDDGSIELWDRKGGESNILKQHEFYVLKVSFSPDGQTLASASSDGVALLWNLNNLDAEPLPLVGHQSSVQSIIFSPDRQYVVTASDDNTVKVWSRKGDLLETLNGHNGRVNSLSFQPVGSSTSDQLVLASSSNDMTIRLWQLGPGKAHVVGSHSGEVYAASFSPDGQSFATAGLEERILVWDTKGQVVNVIDSQSGLVGPVYGLDFSADKKLLGSASSGGVAQFWNTSGALVAELKGHTKDVYGISFSPTESKVATSSLDNTAKLWDLEGNLLADLKGHTAAVQEVVFSPNGGLLATASEDGTVKVWDQTGKVLHTLNGSAGPVYSVVFSPDNRSVAASGADNLARVWDIERPDEPVVVLQGHLAPIWSVAFSQDGQKIATASDDKTVRLWQKDGTLITTLNGHAQEVNTVDFNQDETALVTGGSDNRVIVWDIKDISLDQLMTEGCDWVRDYLSQRRSSSVTTKEISTASCPP